MNIRRKVITISALFFSILSVVNGSEIKQSSRNEIFENPFVVVGFNPKTNILTGYVVALRTTPGKTDECKFIFMGERKKSPMSVLVKNAVSSPLAGIVEPQENSRGELTLDSMQNKLLIKKQALPGDCEWILSFIGEEKIPYDKNVFSISIDGGIPGDWLAVSVIQSKRAFFHKEPDETTVSKAFLVGGDLVYVFEEKAGWYYVKYKMRKKETVGWIRKIDTVQFSP